MLIHLQDDTLYNYSFKKPMRHNIYVVMLNVTAGVINEYKKKL